MSKLRDINVFVVGIVLSFAIQAFYEYAQTGTDSGAATRILQSAFVTVFVPLALLLIFVDVPFVLLVKKSTVPE
jgi:hypothetical protein